MYTLNCEHCGKEYQSARKDKRFCCDSHRAMHNKGQAFVAQNETKRNVTTLDLSQIIESISTALVLSDPVNNVLDTIDDIAGCLRAILYRLENPLTMQTVTYTATMPIPQVPTFEPPKVNVAFDEAAAKARSIANTLASISDF